jgi:hypothetical protein
MLYKSLSAPGRPVFPEPALGYTHPFSVMHGKVYGTLFEYLVLGYGFWVPFVICFVISEFLEFRMNVRFRGRWQVLVVAAISMALLYGIWQLSNCVSRP